jgi:hypothetical protein
MKFSDSAASHSSSVTDRMPSKRVASAPALLTRTSTPPPFGGRGDQPVWTLRCRKVGGDEGGRPGGFELLQFRGVMPGARDDEGPCFGERPADGQADSLARSGDDDDLVREVHVHAPYLPLSSACLGHNKGRPT